MAGLWKLSLGGYRQMNDVTKVTYHMVPCIPQWPCGSSQGWSLGCPGQLLPVYKQWVLDTGPVPPPGFSLERSLTVEKNTEFPWERYSPFHIKKCGS